jgi:NADH:ubiquinone oxidoreductase subunit 6 (subunit J)
VNAFHVCGALFALWALVVSFLGITRESFPSTAGAARAVGVISAVLCLAAIGTAIYTSATEEHESEEQAALRGS